MPSSPSAQPAKQAAPCTVVIFGASGDLTQRKLVPALFNLQHEKVLPEGFALVGFARRYKSDEQFREEMHTGVAAYSRTQPVDAGEWAAFANNIHYHTAEFDDPAAYAGLRELLDRLDTERGVEPGQGNRLFYLATPPDAYPRIVTHLGEAGLNGTAGRRGSSGWTRIIIEKPFGRDLASAEELNAHVLGVFDETQVYRIDHYLGKETVQNILTFRLGNSIFEPLWNRRYIDHVQILVAEQIGVEGRGGYYDTAGAIRDMVQNHMLQVLALIAMEPPAAFTADGVRNEKVKALQAIRPVAPEETGQFTVRGQYTDYRNEAGVARNSATETFVAMKLAIDNWRWAGVPFYLRTGKSLPQRLTEVRIQFRQPPLMLFSHDDGHPGHSGPEHSMEPNVLALRIQPNEGINLCIGLKPPGSSLQLQPVELGFNYGEGFGKESPEAYERLLLDAILGDATLFIRRDEVEAAWSLITPIMEGWAQGHAAKPAPYWPGTWGPEAADTLIERDGRAWHKP